MQKERKEVYRNGEKVKMKITMKKSGKLQIHKRHIFPVNS
jgi:hypothetical protein